MLHKNYIENIMKKLLLFILAIPFLFSSCSSIKVFADYDPSADFSTYKTFSYLPWNKQSDQLLTDFDKRRFRAAVTFEMEALGYTKVEVEGDLTINIFLIVDQKTGTSAYTDYYTSGVGVGYYYGPWGYNNPGGVSAYTTMHSYDYKEGTLILDLLDREKKQLAWQGTAKGTLKSNPAAKDEGIKSVIYRLFTKFPQEEKKK